MKKLLTGVAMMIALLSNPSAAVAEMNGPANFHQTTGQIARKALLQMAPASSPTTEAHRLELLLHT